MVIISLPIRNVTRNLKMYLSDVAAELIEMNKLMEMIENEEIECPKCGCKLGYDNCDFLKS